MNYYNEIDAYAAQWLKNSIAAGLIPAGDVDERSIADVGADDLRGYAQCHFFAGLGGWAEALRLAGWPHDEQVWTGSCPCQPFSLAGKRKGFADDRHLWPEWLRLIRQCSPPIVFGEQVASGTAWLGLVRSDLETLGYAVGAIPIEAASANADQLRDRFWFVAGSDSGMRVRRSEIEVRRPQGGIAIDGPGLRTMEHAESFGWGEGFTEAELRCWGPAVAVASVGSRQVIECPDGKWRTIPPPRVRWLGNGILARIPKLRTLGNAIDPRPASKFIIAAHDCLG